MAENLHVEFFMQAVENPLKTKAEGRPIFEDREMIRIRFPGDNKRILVDYANSETTNPETRERATYAERFPKHYEAFTKNQSYNGEGTPLSELPFLTEAKRAELRALNIQTAEALANMPERNRSALGMGGQQLMMQARAYLERAQGSALETKMAAENADLRAQIEIMRQQIAGLAQQKPAPAHVADEDEADDETGGSPFETWADADLKALIKDRSGNAPRGNPSHETLVRMADEAVQAAQKAA